MGQASTAFSCSMAVPLLRIAAAFQPLCPVGGQPIQQAFQRALFFGREGGEQLRPAAENVLLVPLNNPGPPLLCDGQGHLPPVFLAAHPGNQPLVLQLGCNLTHGTGLDAQKLLEFLLGNLSPLAQGVQNPALPPPLAQTVGKKPSALLELPRQVVPIHVGLMAVSVPMIPVSHFP